MHIRRPLSKNVGVNWIKVPKYEQSAREIRK
jgi:hypothetical protein